MPDTLKSSPPFRGVAFFPRPVSCAPFSLLLRVTVVAALSTAHSAPAADGPRRLPAVGPFRPREHAFYCRCRVTRRVAAKTWPRPREGADVGDVAAPCARNAATRRVSFCERALAPPGRAGRLPIPSRSCALFPFDLIGDVLRWPLLACALTMEQRRIALTRSHLGASVCKLVVTVSREKFETAPFGPAAVVSQGHPGGGKS